MRNGKHPTILANFSDDLSKKDSPDNKTKTSDKKVKKDEKAADNKEVTSKRLNELLSSMVMGTNLSMVKDVIKPKSAIEKKERKAARSIDSINEEPPKSENITEAAKKVAETLGGDVKKTESELLKMLKANKETNMNLSELIGNMKIDRNTSPPFERRSDVVRKSIGQRPFQRNDNVQGQRPFQRNDNVQGQRTFQRYDNVQDSEGIQRPRRDRRDQQPKSVRGSADLFGGKPLGIFKNISDLSDSPDILSTWNYLHQRELKLAVTHPPRNYFEKMALWTEQGKLWKFPIDNEQGMDEEAKNYFTEHVFLEKHLESWCPTKGPIRHFMELVCVGLSKNPYFTVTQKKEHIEWFRDYFAEKKELLDSIIVDSDTPKELEK